MGFVFRLLTSTRSFASVVSLWAVWSSWQFILNLDKNLEIHTLEYENNRDIAKDCTYPLESTDFLNSCKKSQIYIKKSMWMRSFMKTISDTGLCGSHYCWDYIFGPDFTWQGKIIQALFVIFILWIIFAVLSKGKNLLNYSGSYKQKLLLQQQQQQQLQYQQQLQQLVKYPQINLVPTNSQNFKILEHQIVEVPSQQ
jgi:hypothetical protein